MTSAPPKSIHVSRPMVRTAPLALAVKAVDAQAVRCRGDDLGGGGEERVEPHLVERLEHLLPSVALKSLVSPMGIEPMTP
jgi:hypothetical protein